MSINAEPASEEGAACGELLTCFISLATYATDLTFFHFWPLHLAFRQLISDGVAPALLWFADIVFWTHVFANFRTSVQPPGHVLPITNPLSLAKLYAQGGLFLDLCASLPHAALPSPFEDDSGWVQILRFVWLLRIRSIIGSRVLEYVSSNQVRGVLLLLKWALISFYLAQLAGCFWWHLSAMRLRDALCTNSDAVVWGFAPFPPGRYAAGFASWTSNHSNAIGGDALPTKGLGACHLHALTWGVCSVSGLGLMSIGDLEDDAFVALLMVLAVTAVLVNAIVIGEVAAGVARIQSKQTREQEDLASVEDYLQANDVPSELRSRINDFYNFVGGISRVADNPLPALPPQMQLELDVFNKRMFFLKVPMFRMCSVAQLMDIIPLVESFFASPGRYLLREGYEGTGLVVIAQGQVAILVAGQEVSRRFAGEAMGEISLLSNDDDAVASASGITATWSQLMALSRENFRIVGQIHPALVKIVA